jgi:hypothetical protein
LLLLLMSCSSREPASAPPAVTPEVVAPEPEPELRYVQASVLKLRTESSEDSELRGRLAINTPLELLETRASWAKVRVANGVEGWVVASYLAPEPLTVDRALERGQSTGELSWYQRAAAIEQTPRTLEPLLMKYRTEQDAPRAEIVSRQLAFSQDILLRPLGYAHLGRDPWPIEWRHDTYIVGEFVEGELEPWELAQEGLTLGETWWLLPPSGPAVEGKLVGASRELWSECSGDRGVTVFVEAVLDAEPFAATRKPPPESWMKQGPSSTRGAEEAQRLVEQHADALHETHWVTVTPVEGGWRGQIVWSLAPEEHDDPPPDGIDWYDIEAVVVQVLLPDQGPIQELSRSQQLEMLVSVPAAYRDVDGDGDIDEVLDGCATELHDADGTLLRSSADRCCGC